LTGHRRASLTGGSGRSSLANPLWRNDLEETEGAGGEARARNEVTITFDGPLPEFPRRRWEDATISVATGTDPYPFH
jgi:hypothetical protein